MCALYPLCLPLYLGYHTPTQAGFTYIDLAENDGKLRFSVQKRPGPFSEGLSVRPYMPHFGAVFVTYMPCPYSKPYRGNATKLCSLLEPCKFHVMLEFYRI